MRCGVSKILFKSHDRFYLANTKLIKRGNKYIYNITKVFYFK